MMWGCSRCGVCARSVQGGMDRARSRLNRSPVWSPETWVQVWFSNVIQALNRWFQQGGVTINRKTLFLIKGLCGIPACASSSAVPCVSVSPHSFTLLIATYCLPADLWKVGAMPWWLWISVAWIWIALVAYQRVGLCSENAFYLVSCR